MKIGIYKGIKDSIDVEEYVDMVMRVFDHSKVMVADFSASKRKDGKWGVEVNIIDNPNKTNHRMYRSGCDKKLAEILNGMTVEIEEDTVKDLKCIYCKEEEIYNGGNKQ